jgi:tetratricopeptide (TPR) repeat protein
MVGALLLLTISAAAAERGPERPSLRHFWDSATPPRLESAEQERLTNQKRDEAIEQLERIIAKSEVGSPHRADLLYQLSELNLEKAKYFERKEVAKHEEAYRQYQEQRRRGQRVREPKEEHPDSERYRAQAMRVYEAILKDYPSYDRRDEVLFALGYHLYDLGRRDQGIARYLELTRSQPNSRLVPDTYLQLGNHYFDVANDLQRGRENYEKALASKAPKIYSYALYKLAWCDYNAGRPQDALAKLKEVVSYANARGNEILDLKNEALADTVGLFVQLDRADQAIAYLDQNAPPERRTKLITRLGIQLHDAGHHQSAIEVFKRLLASSPNQPDAPEIQKAIVRGYEGLRRRDQVREEVQLLAERYRPGSAWWQANQAKPQVLKTGFEVSEEAMRNLATEYHQEAQKTKSLATFRLARDVYRDYVEAFGSSSDPKWISDYAFNLRFYYAELLWALQQWDAAAAQYEAVLDFKIPDRESAREISDQKHRARAAFDAVLAYDKLVRIERGLLPAPNLKEGQLVEVSENKGGLARSNQIDKREVKGAKQQPLTQHEQKLVTACDRFSRMFPEDANDIDIRYQAAVIYYDRKQYVEATRRLGEIIERWPQEKRSQEAADLSMYVLEAQGEWSALSKLSRQFLQNKRLTKPGSEFAQRVQRVADGSQYKWIDEVLYRREKKGLEAAREFDRFARVFPKSPNAPRALASAVLILNEAGQLDGAIEMGERMLREYRNSALALKVLYGLARDYEKTARFAKAAQVYANFVAACDRLAESSSKGAKAAENDETKEQSALIAEAKRWLPDAQYNAALWWEALGQTAQASAAYRQYLTRFESNPDAPEIELRIAMILEKAERWQEAATAYEAFEKRHHKDRRVSAAKRYWVKYRLLLANQQLGRSKQEALQDELLASYSRIGKEARGDDRVQGAYAHLRFTKVEPLWTGYTSIRLNRNSTLKNDLHVKQQRLQSLEREYVKVLEIGVGEYGIAALTRIGQSYLDMAENILSSPDPRGLNAEQLELYRGELQNLASPLEQKAEEAFVKALAKAHELSIYNKWTLLAQQKIDKLHPGPDAAVPEVAYLGSESSATAPLQKDATLSPEVRSAGRPVQKQAQLGVPR